MDDVKSRRFNSAMSERKKRMHTNNVSLWYSFFNELTVDRPFERTDNVITKQMDWPQFVFRRDLLS